MLLVAQALAPMFRPGDLVVVDPSYTPNLSKTLSVNGLELKTIYLVHQVENHANGQRCELQKDDGTLTEMISSHYLLPRPK